MAGFPFKVFEYMALGKAIVVEGKEQMREVLEEGEHALFYRSVEELANALVVLARDPGRRQKLGRSARAVFEAGHTLEARRRDLDGLIAGHKRPSAFPA
jgi:glycosyltransferase involved in cell wall biosynthesis